MSLDTDYFAQLMSSELDVSKQLFTLLQQELDAVQHQRTADLDTLNPAKAQQVADLKQQAGIRLKWMQSHELPLTPECLCHPDLQQNTSVLELWQQLAAQYDLNRQISERLSEMVIALRFRAEQKLRILHARQNDPHLYNENGKTAGANPGFKSIEA
ncbi:flagellar export chaperone FlgN [Thalassolituus maritimus]|uniref:Flagella synthesis protein FlgN n=1 Tax=Thalassolituus maritimus TaxID=484498 RepID=A0ABQ0A0E4_9GAMM